VQELQRERDAPLTPCRGLRRERRVQEESKDVLKLRGEVGRLRQENADLGSTSGLSKLTANAEPKMVRDQQKWDDDDLQRIWPTPEADARTNRKIHDLLADHIMDNVIV